MTEVSMQEFIANAKSYLVGAASNDDFVKIETGAGTAVLISEAEWNILVDSMKVVLQSAK